MNRDKENGERTSEGISAKKTSVKYLDDKTVRPNRKL